jgi:uncharacterized protein (TIGR02001 family)
MKNKTMKILSSSLIAASMMSLSTVSMAEEAESTVSITGNAGFMSEYIYRGVYQEESVANGGLDLSMGGAYAGVWVADVGADNGDGLEYDLYFGYIHEMENFYVGAGYTAYRYTEDWDDNYDEINLYAGTSVGDFTADLTYSLGEYDGSFTTDPDDDDYSILELSLGYGGWFANFGSWGDDADDFGEYVEFGYGMDIGGISVSGYIVHNEYEDDVTTGDGDDDEQSAVITISWGFDVI